VIDAPLPGRRYRKLGGKAPGGEVVQETASLEERLQTLSAALTARQARLDATHAACRELAARNTEAHDAGLETAVQVPVYTACISEVLSLPWDRLKHQPGSHRSQDGCCRVWPLFCIRRTLHKVHWQVLAAASRS